MKRGHLILLTAIVLIYSLTNLALDFPLPNFSPMAAMVFCAASWFSGRTRWALPLAAWFLVSVCGSYFQAYSFISGSWLTGLCYFLIFLIALSCSRVTRKPAHLFWLSLSAPLVFYLLSNFVSFLLDPRYLKTLSGFTQAMWTGNPADPYPATWVFLRNSLVANSLFSAVFFSLAVAQNLKSREAAPENASLSRT